MIKTPRRPPSEDKKCEEFAAHVAHDLNNLLTAMLGNLELMQSRASRIGRTDFDDYLKSAAHAGERASLFAQRLLVFSGNSAEPPVKLEILSLVRSVVESRRAQGMHVSFTSTMSPARFFGHPAQLELALRELLNNAAEATRESGEITLEVERTGGRLAIILRDTGAGMSPEVLVRAGEPFFTTRENPAGRGLGLAIVERIARQAGGALHISSEPGSGTTMRLEIQSAEPKSPRSRA